MPNTDYMALADAIAAGISAGRFKPGDRLPPQRTFAYEKGIAVSTAGRVYAELLRRGLVVGEVGRGTFVAGTSSSPIPRGVPLDGHIDLEFNFPTVPSQGGLIARAMSGLQRADVAGAATGPISNKQIEAARKVFAEYLASRAWRPEADALVFTGSGRQSIAAALSALVPVGGRVAVEAMSYPLIKNIAQRIGAQLIPIPMDNAGLVPDKIVRAHRKTALSAIYVQPVMHNPIGVTMPAERRAEIVRTAKRLGVIIVEDLVYGFLSDVPPLASIDPEQCIVADSLSKRLAPGISVGILHVPSALRDRMWSTVRGGTWNVPSLALNVAGRMLQDGSAAEIVRLKRQDARRRQAIIGKALAGFETAADPSSFHVWLKLPDGWRSEAFVAAAARTGVAVTPSSAFAMAPGHAPPAIRLALGLPPHDELRIAAARLVEILRRQPDEADVTE
jgi:DNA-binding transcriptional MocR family regulator